MTAGYREVGAAAAEAILDAFVAAADDYQLDAPAIVVRSTGNGVPTADACDGMVWTRVANVFPTDGSGAAQTATRFDSAPVAWAFLIEVGFLWCHQNITEDGGWVEPDVEIAYAERDAQWRAAMLDAVGYRWMPAVEGEQLGEALLGQTISPLTPVGPDGGYSGGIVQVTVIARGVLLCVP